ncbi:hypothetical protein HHK36_012131 [Tetracentron sinense]|uniref:Uncharacterized protein n=1 Tax=Tetracentron sinense TaxID=13715 RepID=A0A834Z8G1_TETSI|nr:hypothetical protein HHK36_012131 [Tetracentron sinense]
MLASDDTMTGHYSSRDENEYDVEEEEEDHPVNLSRLSMCTNNSMCDDEMGIYMSRLSMEGSDADGELSDDKEASKGVSSESDKEPECYSLPATPTPTRRRVRRGCVDQVIVGGGVRDREYGSENEARTGQSKARRRIVREICWIEKKKLSGHESECLVITRPKGGRRSLCMDLEEVKACRDLGFELQHERMLDIPARFSISDTSSGGNSPIANWRISSPGDDPRDVKARLKVWAQAVALASTSRLLS